MKKKISNGLKYETIGTKSLARRKLESQLSTFSSFCVAFRLVASLFYEVSATAATVNRNTWSVLEILLKKDITTYRLPRFG